jgi:hypothetical protein
MEGFLLLAFFLLLGPLALLFGADSRSWDERDRRGWWPGGEKQRSDAPDLPSSQRDQATLGALRQSMTEHQALAREHGRAAALAFDLRVFEGYVEHLRRQQWHERREAALRRKVTESEGRRFTR